MKRWPKWVNGWTKKAGEGMKKMGAEIAPILVFPEERKPDLL